MEKIGPWTRLKSEVVYENPWVKIFHEDVVNPNGNPGIYGRVHYRNRAVGVIPIDEKGYTWLVGQHRYPLNEYSWEIPEGGSPYEEDLLETANRELLEETGLMANKWELILKMHLSNSVSDEVGFVYLAKELTQGKSNPEDTEDLQIKKVHITEAIQMAISGEITDSLSVAGLLKLKTVIE